MKYIRMFFFFLTMSVLVFSFQNFRTVQPKLSDELKEETKFDPNSSTKNVENFYRLQYAAEEKKGKLYKGPKDYLKQKLENSPLYKEGEEWIEDVVEGGERVRLQAPCHPNCKKAISERAKKESIDWRVNPLKQEAKMYYRGEWNADLAYNQEDANLEVKVHRDFKESNAKLEIQHQSDSSETYLNYLLNW